MGEVSAQSVVTLHSRLVDCMHVVVSGAVGELPQAAAVISNREAMAHIFVKSVGEDYSLGSLLLVEVSIVMTIGFC